MPSGILSGCFFFFFSLSLKLFGCIRTKIFAAAFFESFAPSRPSTPCENPLSLFILCFPSFFLIISILNLKPFRDSLRLLVDLAERHATTEKRRKNIFWKNIKRKNICKNDNKNKEGKKRITKIWRLKHLYLLIKIA